jgi:ABC-type dipeptide/oligopeptide/nickel transport system ATPase subunit
MTRKKDLTRVKGGDKFKYGILSRAKVKKNHLFDGDECISELDVAVSAEGIQLADDIKSFEDIKGWDDKEDD